MDIRLEDEQLRLLQTLVEAQRSLPRDERRKVIVARMLQGDVLVHPGIPEEQAEFYFGDLEVLERYGLVYITYPGKSPNVDVTPEGYTYYDALQRGDDGALDSEKGQEELARELLMLLDRIREEGYQDEDSIQRAKVLNAQLAPSYTQLYGAVPLISTDYPPRIWWTRARENASQALAVAAAGLVTGTQEERGSVVQHSRRVFIVHGREHGLKEAAARLIERFGYEAVVLHEKANQGRTLIEKFEQEADAAFAVVLLTPDDQGGLRPSADEPSVMSPRARQNVVWEFGYFAGAMGRARVAALVPDEDLEQPSDLAGIIYIPVRGVDDMEWRLNLAREMRAAGLDVDLNKLAD